MIERVEILTEGASATYGADAVAGVVNIVTRTNFDGAEAGSRISGISEGKAPNYAGNILLGHDWSTGNVTLDYDYAQDNPLYARNRSFTSTIPDPHNLLPEQKTSTIYGSVRQDAGDKLTFSGDLLYAVRKPSSWSSLFDEFGRDSSRAEQLGANIQADIALPKGWQASFIGQASRETDTTNTEDFTGSSLIRNAFRNESRSFEARADGALFETGAGIARMALGASTRREKFNTSRTETSADSPVDSTHTDNERDVQSLYGELRIPLVNPESHIPLARTISVDLAGRYDHYSDFGGTFNPKVALQWSPIVGVSVHGSYGRSFLAPTLYALSSALNDAYIFNVSDPASPTGTTPALLIDGTNPELGPQRSKSYNFGISFQPPAAPNFSADLSYFDIRFKDKVERLVTRGFFTNVVTSADLLGNLVNLNPTISEINQELNSPGRNVHNFAGATPEQITAIAHIGYVNAAGAHPKGFDLSTKYILDSQIGRISMDLYQSYFLTYEQQITPASPPFSILNTAYNPLRYRAKADLGWESGSWRAYTRVNYSNPYRNPEDTSCADVAGCHVSAWTTVDVGASFSTQDGNSASDSQGLRVSVDVSNLFNTSPPFVFNEGGYNYDPTNAGPLLRSIAVTVTKRW